MKVQRGWFLAFSLLSSACASAPRFLDQPVVWRVDDTVDTPPLASREFLVHDYAADIMVFRRMTRALEVRGHVSALDANAWDEVPDSTWFTNRIGRREVTTQEAVQGAGSSPPQLPLVLTSVKQGGTNPGFVAADITGRKFVIKFDPADSLELQTAAGAIVNRIFHAIGYNVPSDHVLEFARSDVTIKPGTVAGNSSAPFTPAMLDAILAKAPRLANGSFRASSSELLAGVPKGGFAMEGVRSGDPNDRIPHEHRRSLRGLRVFAAWLDHTDMKEDNGLDMYVEDRGRHYLRHYLIDFGETLGGHAAEKHRMEDGYENAWDWQKQAQAALTLGLWTRPWEDRKPSPWPSLGPLASSDFDPLGWREAYPYWPFAECDAADAYWAARIVMRFDRPLVEALVGTGQLSNPLAAAKLTDTLLARREKIGRAYLEAVTPLDDFQVREGRLCAVDLSTRYGLVRGGLVETMTEGGKVIDRAAIGPDGGVCLSPPLPNGYVVRRLRIRRSSSAPQRPLQVHVQDASRILGILRIEP